MPQKYPFRPELSQRDRHRIRCDDCGKLFLYRASLNKHCQTQHRHPVATSPQAPPGIEEGVKVPLQEPPVAPTQISPQQEIVESVVESQPARPQGPVQRVFDCRPPLNVNSPIRESALFYLNQAPQIYQLTCPYPYSTPYIFPQWMHPSIILQPALYPSAVFGNPIEHGSSFLPEARETRSPPKKDVPSVPWPSCTVPEPGPNPGPSEGLSRGPQPHLQPGQNDGRPLEGQRQDQLCLRPAGEGPA